MTFQARAPQSDKAQKLKILCAPEGDAHRIYVWPTWLPEYLRRHLDGEGEAYPVFVDLEELDRQMVASGVTYEKRESIGNRSLGSHWFTKRVACHCCGGDQRGKMVVKYFGRQATGLVLVDIDKDVGNRTFTDVTEGLQCTQTLPILARQPRRFVHGI